MVKKREKSGRPGRAFTSWELKNRDGELLKVSVRTYNDTGGVTFAAYVPGINEPVLDSDVNRLHKLVRDSVKTMGIATWLPYYCISYGGRVLPHVKEEYLERFSNATLHKLKVAPLTMPAIDLAEKRRRYTLWDTPVTEICDSYAVLGFDHDCGEFDVSVYLAKIEEGKPVAYRQIDRPEGHITEITPDSFSGADCIMHHVIWLPVTPENTANVLKLVKKQVAEVTERMLCFTRGSQVSPEKAMQALLACYRD